MSAAPAGRPAERPCPICRRPADPERRPFCSKRCADVDLNRWLSGGYAIPGPSLEDVEEGDAPSERPASPRGDTPDR